MTADNIVRYKVSSLTQYFNTLWFNGGNRGCWVQIPLLLECQNLSLSESSNLEKNLNDSNKGKVAYTKRQKNYFLFIMPCKILSLK